MKRGSQKLRNSADWDVEDIPLPSSAVQEAETVCVSRDSRLTSLDTSSYTRAKWGAEKGMRKLNTVHMPEPDNLSSSVWENKKNLPKHKRVTWEMTQKTLREGEGTGFSISS